MPSDRLASALALIDAVGRELAAHPFAHQTSGAILERIPAPDEAEADRRSSLARGWLATLETIDPVALPAPLSLQLELVDATARRIARESEWYWTVHDPIGLGFFGLFGPTAYCGGWYIGILARQIGSLKLDRSADVDRYLSLLTDLAKLVDAMRHRLSGQAARGLRMPPSQLRQARELVAALSVRLPEQLTRSSSHPATAKLIDAALRPALSALGRELESAEPGEDLGMCQYPDGEAIYAALVRHHTTLDLDPDDVHRIGEQRMAQIRAAMAEVRAEVGFSGDDRAYRAFIASQPGFAAGGASDIAARFERCFADIDPLLDNWFHRRPAAAHGVAALPTSLSGSMTFGYYQVAAGAGATGRYLFNVPTLQAAGLATVPALAFHELVPGHHIHLASQAEDECLPAVMRFNSFNAFNEGWAEYAATLAGEHGLYRTPEERFGRLMMDALLTSRLVADTGLNARGWSVEEARAYLMVNAFVGEREAGTEAIRYGCDVPGQALAYKLGDTFLLAERDRMRTALGDGFDIRDFHEAVLRNGALPLPMVTREVDHAIAALA